ncbi:MAG: endo alpha-1,4 polygalactosaminidase [Planctomycetes bacterium]|nr:endo alpha-1,4 polygalactosaminidase [Planctomycetota bacterium]
MLRPGLAAAARALTLCGLLLVDEACRGGPEARPRLQSIREWACAYGADASPALLDGFDLLIVDPDGPPDLSTYRGIVLAYLSVGEVNESRDYFDRVPKGDEDPNWPGGYRIDLSGGVWQRLVLEEILPRLASYDGVFLDTVDAAFITGQEREMVHLIRAVREALRDRILVVNNPERLVDQIDVDAVMAEGVFTRYEFALKAYRLNDPDVAARRALRYRKHIVLNLEYAIDPVAAHQVAQISRGWGFIPYVTEISLVRPTTHHRRAP